MVDEKVVVPLSDPSLSVRVIALHRGKDAGPFSYLQAIRSGYLKAFGDPEETEVARSYRRNERDYVEALTKAVGENVDAVISPPSRLAWQAAPYRKSILANNAKAIDLTARLPSQKGIYAGEGTTVPKVVSELSFAPTGEEMNIRRLVIVDDTFNTGTTAAAIITVIRNYGLPNECEIIVACPLWLEPKRASSQPAT